MPDAPRTVRDIAAEAYAVLVEQERIAELTEADRRRAEADRARATEANHRNWANGILLRPDNPLLGWFPDEHWVIEHVDPYHHFIVVMPRSEYDIEKNKDRLNFMIHVEGTGLVPPDEIEKISGVTLTTYEIDRDSQSNYWSGTFGASRNYLKGPGEVGRWLRERDALLAQAAAVKQVGIRWEGPAKTIGTGDTLFGPEVARRTVPAPVITDA